MSKQSENKATQGYEKVGPSCGNCDHFESAIVVENSYDGLKKFTLETSMRCAVGGFKVLKGGWCAWHSRNDLENKP